MPQATSTTRLVRHCEPTTPEVPFAIDKSQFAEQWRGACAGRVPATAPSGSEGAMIALAPPTTHRLGPSKLLRECAEVRRPALLRVRSTRMSYLTTCTKVTWPTPPAGPKPRQTLGSEEPDRSIFGPESAPNVFNSGHDVGKNHNGPDRILEELLVRHVLAGAPGGI